MSGLKMLRLLGLFIVIRSTISVEFKIGNIYENWGFKNIICIYIYSIMR